MRLLRSSPRAIKKNREQTAKAKDPFLIRRELRALRSLLFTLLLQPGKDVSARMSLAGVAGVDPPDRSPGVSERRSGVRGEGQPNQMRVLWNQMVFSWREGCRSWPRTPPE